MLLKRLIFTSIVGVVILAVIIQSVNLANLSQRLSAASLDWVAASFVTFICTYLLRAIRWKIILGNTSKFSNLFHILQIGYLSNNVLPFHLSEVVRSLILKEKEKVDLGYGLSSIVLERMMDVISLLILVIAAASIFPSLETRQLWVSGVIQNSGILATGVLAVLITFTIRPQPFIKIILFTKRIPQVNKLSGNFEEFATNLSNGIKNMSKKKLNFTVSFAMTFVIWLVDFVAVYFLFNSLGFSITPSAVLFGYIVTMLLLALPSTPGYIGSYELFLVGAFLALGYDQSDQILAVGILAHILFISITTIFGVVGMIALRIPFKNILAKSS